MGKHKDPETLKFIESLKKKAESLGFKVNDEYKLMKGYFWVDLTLTPYEKGHDTFITFEIESEDNERIHKNLSKIFNTPAKDIEKPFHHFIIIYNGKLTKSNEYLLGNQTRNYNIEILENLKEQPEQAERLFRELEDLALEIESLIERKGKVNPTEAIQEAISGLGKITPVLFIDDLKYPLYQIFLASCAEKKQDKPSETSTALQFDSKKYRKIAVVPYPRDQYTLLVPGTKSVLEVFLEKVKEDNKSISYVAEACNYPFIVNFELTKPEGATTELKIDPLQADVVQLKVFEDLRRDIHRRNIEIFYPSGKFKLKVLGEESEEPLPSDSWYAGVSDLAFIQKATGIKILSPKNMTLTSKDYMDIKRLKSIINDGNIAICIEYYGFTANKDVVQKLYDRQREYGVLSNIVFQIDQTSEWLLDQEILMGPSNIFLPEMKFKDSLEEVKRKIDECESNSSMQQFIIPTSENRIQASYLHWSKASDLKKNVVY